MARSARRQKRRERARSELKNLSYEIFIGLLSIMSIVNIALEWIVRDAQLQQILWVMNGIFSLIFLIDFTFRISTAPSASRYFFRGFGWADLLASLPLAELKILRLFRVLRVYRLMRQLGPRTIVRRVVRDRANSALMTLLLMGVIVMQYGSLAVLKVEEHASGANIVTASDALWYTIVTISTVGYGDQYPVTNAGRIIGTFIIIVGVGIFGTFTGYLANAFLGPGKSGDSTGGTTDAESSDATSDAPADATAQASAPAAASAGARGLVDGSPEGVADAASKGVAAGGAKGAVAAGAHAGAGARPATAATPSLGASVEGTADELAQLRELLRRSESALADSEAALAEMRGVLDAAR